MQIKKALWVHHFGPPFYSHIRSLQPSNWTKSGEDSCVPQHILIPYQNTLPQLLLSAIDFMVTVFQGRFLPRSSIFLPTKSFFANSSSKTYDAHQPSVTRCHVRYPNVSSVFSDQLPLLSFTTVNSSQLHSTNRYFHLYQLYPGYMNACAVIHVFIFFSTLPVARYCYIFFSVTVVLCLVLLPLFNLHPHFSSYLSSHNEPWT